MRACSQHWTQWPWSQGPYEQGSLCTCPRSHQYNHLHGRKQLLVYSPLQQETGTILLLWIVIFPGGMRERMPLILCWKVDTLLGCLIYDPHFWCVHEHFDIVLSVMLRWNLQHRVVAGSIGLQIKLDGVTVSLIAFHQIISNTFPLGPQHIC